MKPSNANFEENSYENFEQSLDGKSVVIFGAGRAGKLAYDDVRGITKILYFIDNNPWLWKTEFQGLIIKPPNNLKNEDTDNIVVLITTTDVFSAENQLLEYGIKHYYSYLMFFDRLMNIYDRIAIDLTL